MLANFFYEFIKIHSQAKGLPKEAYMMIGSKAHFAEHAPAKVDLGPAGHEQVATNVADCECPGARELVRGERSAS